MLTFLLDFYANLFMLIYIIYYNSESCLKMLIIPSYSNIVYHKNEYWLN